MGLFSWDHNAFYHRLVLDRLPDRCGRILEVGCGRGEFATILATRADHVDALDRSPGMVAAARRTVPANVTVREADVLVDDLPPGHYDAVVGISSLHHLSLDVALPRLAAATRPGGTIAMVALPRSDLPRELPLELVAVCGQLARGVPPAVRRLRAGRLGDPPPPVGEEPMPMMDGARTTAQVRHEAERLLPGVRVRRLLYWRYLLEWHRPAR